MTPSGPAGNRYPAGTYAKVARRLGITRQGVRLVALGLSTSIRVQRELDREWRKAQRKAEREQMKAAG